MHSNVSCGYGERLDHIDACKGIGILLVILGHTNVPSIVHTIIYSFHMPLFFIISGYLFSEAKCAAISTKEYI